MVASRLHFCCIRSPRSVENQERTLTPVHYKYWGGPQCLGPRAKVWMVIIGLD